MKQGLKVTLVALLMMIGVLVGNCSFAAVPSYDYTGTSSISEDDTYWYIYLKSSGTITFTGAQTLDAFLVGGGGGGGGVGGTGSGGYHHGGGGGGGGYTQTYSGIITSANQGYSIIVGEGGTPGTADSVRTSGGDGGSTTAFGFTVAGGHGGSGQAGGAGGASGGRGGTGWSASGSKDSSVCDGRNGSSQNATAFSAGGTVYGGGGGGGGAKTCSNGSAGDSSAGNGGAISAPANRGGGGGGHNGDRSGTGGYGGSGIVILRGRLDGSGGGGVPSYSYSDTSVASMTTDSTYWYIYIRGNGTLTFTNAQKIDAFLVGGGGGGGGVGGTGSGGYHNGGGGGGGGYAQTYYNISTTAGQGYSIVIGAGGAPGTADSVRTAGEAGGTTSAFGYSANGGTGGNGRAAGTGGASGGTGGQGWRKDASQPSSSLTKGGNGSSQNATAFSAGGTVYGGGGGGGGAKSCANGSAGDSSAGNGGAISAPANRGGGGGGHNGDRSGTGGYGGSGIVIVRGKLCTSHTGGTHSNNGTCTNCGTKYQNHGQSVTVSSYTTTSTQHTPIYKCKYSECTSTYTGTATNHSGATHDNGGKCTTCEYVYQTHSQSTTVSSYTTTATQHTPIYVCSYTGCTSTYTGTAINHGGATHDNGGKCTTCEYVYQTHSQSTTVSSYTTTATQHTPIYVCSYTGCTSTYTGTATNHSGATHDNGGKCTTCEYVYQTHGKSLRASAYSTTDTHHNAIYVCIFSGCTSTYLGTLEEHTGGTMANNGTCTACGVKYMEVGNTNQYYVKLDNGAVRTILTAFPGELIRVGLTDGETAIFTVNSENVTLTVDGNYRTFTMPSETVDITISKQ